MCQAHCSKGFTCLIFTLSQYFFYSYFPNEVTEVWTG